MDEQSRESLEQEIKSAEDVINKLKKFTEALTKTKSNNILNNLCTGLETFLGFDSASKGYDGSGIVYSDLDRLCDGVMGFLKGVLDAVKNENEVTTYDKNEIKLEKVLDTLNTKIGSGREGLAASVEQVKRWLEGYDKNIHINITNFENPLNNLQENITSYNPLGKAKLSLENQQKEAAKWAAKYSASLSLAKNASKELDKNLQSRLSDHINIIDVATENFKNCSENKDLQDLFNKSSDGLKTLQGNVENKVTGRIIELRNTIQNTFESQIKIPIEDVNTGLHRVKKDLEQWLYTAHWIVGKALKRVEKIMDKLDAVDRSKKNPPSGEKNDEKNKVTLAADTLRAKAEELRKAAEKTKEDVEQLVNEARMKLSELETSLKWDLGKVKNEIRDRVTDVLSAIGSLGSVFRDHGSHLAPDSIEKIMQQMKREMDFIERKVGKTKGLGSADPANDSLYHNWDAIKDDVRGFVESTIGEHGGQPAGTLKLIVEGVTNYAKGFGTNTFVTVLTKWVEESVNETGTIVSNKIQEYATYNNNKIKGGGITNRVETVKDAIKKILPGRIDTDIQSAAIKANLKDTTVKDIHNRFELFAEKVGMELTGDDSSIGAAISAIGTSVKSGDQLPDNASLTSAVNAVVNSIIRNFKQVSAELQRFAKESKIERLTQVISEIDDIAKHFDEGKMEYINSHGKKIDAALRDIKPRIATLHHQLTTVLDLSARDSVSSTAKSVDDAIQKMKATLEEQLPWDPAVVAYNTRGVKLDMLTRYENVSDGNKGTKKNLNDAITNIKDTGLSPLANLLVNTAGEDKKIGTETFKNMLDSITQALTKFTDAVKSLVKDSTEKHDVNSYLTDLHNMLEEKGDTAYQLASDVKVHHQSVQGLQKIHKDICNILGGDKVKDPNRNNLSQIIENAKTFLNQTLPQETHKAFNDINEHVKTEFEKTKENIRNKAQRLYATRKKSELDSLKNMVEKEKLAIEAIIKHDKENGLKGFLWKLIGENGKDIYTLKTAVLESTTSGEGFKKLSNAFKLHLQPTLQYVREQVRTPELPSVVTDDIHSERVYDTHSNINQLLRHFGKDTNTYNFDDTFVTSLLNLKSSLADLFPPRFSGHEQPLLLDSLKNGLTLFCEELDKAYVNTYSGQTIKWEEESNSDKTYCAKIMVTITKIFGDDLALLKHGCENGWKESTICLLYQSGRYNHLGNFLRNCGYVVTKKDGSQNGELQCSAKMIGKSIVNKFGITVVSRYDSRLLMETLELLVDHIKDYYETCHLGAWQSKTYPSSVYDMLRWLSGFAHNGVYQALSFNGFEELFEKPKEDDTITIEADGITGTNLNALSLSAYPHDIKPSNLADALTDVCNHSHAVLTTILGHGHGEGVYACEFDTNSAGLVYPADFNALVCMIRDVVNRLYRQLHFLYQQCKYDTALGGWLDCEYGQGVGGSGWRCNVDQCANQTCNQKGGQRANQNASQKADQRCEQHPKCGVKSPLQSFLEDGLQGFLPHNLKSERGKLECSLKSHGTLPCITPMGFSGISQMASHRATGQRIVDVLAGYCGNHTSPLTRICGLFNCILTSAPKTLSDMFGFYYSFLADWKNDRTMTDRLGEQRETAFNAKVSEADFKNPGTMLDITSMFGSTVHKHKTLETSHLTGDMYSLVCCNPSTNSAHPCGAYLRPLCYDICTMFSKEHADKYLSWIVYLTETFYTALQKLLEDCKTTCGADSKKCRIGKCKKDCKTKKLPLSTTAEHGDACKSIVECGYIRPTFFRYGFTHGNVASLSGVSGDSHKRTCTDFCTALGIVTKEGKTLYDIVNKTIPDFLWAIRQKFFWTVVALWSLSLFYLICVMVGRLDVLHIRSHLRIPSSHKITAQSLLAAAQVGRLAKISYLQP